MILKAEKHNTVKKFRKIEVPTKCMHSFACLKLMEQSEYQTSQPRVAPDLQIFKDSFSDYSSPEKKNS